MWDVVCEFGMCVIIIITVNLYYKICHPEGGLKVFLVFIFFLFC